MNAAVTTGHQLRRDDTPRPPLSFAQARLWFLQQLDPATRAYHATQMLRLDGPLDAGALSRALDAIVARHEPLRTTFATSEGEPYQVIGEPHHLPLPLIDLSRRGGEAAARLVPRIVDRLEQWPFDLTTGPLVRAVLLRLDAGEHLLLLVTHHIVDDGYSMRVFARELAVLYPVCRSGEADPLPLVAIRYRDYARWQREQLESGTIPAHLDHWERKLAGMQPMYLPGDRGRPAHPTFAGAMVAFEAPGHVTDRLKKLARDEHASLYVVVLAAFQVLLQRYTGQDDLVIGTPVANRTQPELADLIGFFVNTLVIRQDLSGNPTFRALLRATRETVLEAFDHQDAPFEKIVDRLRPERDLSDNPIFNVNVGLQLPPMAPVSTDGLRIGVVSTAPKVTRFDLEVHARDTGRCLDGEIVYRKDLFDAATIEAFGRHVAALLDAIAADPDRPIGALSIVTADERAALEGWQGERREDETRGVTEMIEQQALETPNAPAVCFEETTLTYRELNARANQLGRWLRANGVATGTPVAVCVTRSHALVIAMLGVWKAGGVYVPLDPAYPALRLSFAIADAGARILLVTPGAAAGVDPGLARVVDLERETAAIAAQDTANPGIAAAAGDAAYVMYTSGSTGTPRGVVVEHGSLTHSIVGYRDRFAFGRGDRLAAVASCAFDISLFEVVTPLVAGGIVDIIGSSRILDLPRLVDDIARATLFHAVPSLMRPLLAEVEQSGRSMRGLRGVFIGGDRVPPALLRDLVRACRPGAVHVLYGPTEATIVCLSHPAGERWTDRTAIGTPLPNVHVRIMDGYGHALPPGVVGEIAIGGPGVARGYLGGDELAAARFLRVEGQRVYRTGDLGRWLPDGTVEFLGRSDQQVKIRGHRIEPAEVEASLREHPLVDEAIVVAQEHAGERRMVVYVIPNEDRLYRDELPALAGEQVEYWRRLFEQTYARPPASLDLAFNTIGWDSSYTGQPLSEAEMREWLDETASRILALRPLKVLEIGCGTGLVLGRVAPHCVEYWGTDISTEALAHVRRIVGANPALAGKVHLAVASADALGAVAGERFDTIIINSVVQYFPDLGYLARVLEGAAAQLAPGGRLFVGDVRNVHLRDAFHASVVLHQADANVSRTELVWRLKRKRMQELLVAPEFFESLGVASSGLHVESVRVKYGAHDSEVTRFRYDVVLTSGAAGDAARTPGELSIHDWQSERLDAESLDRLLVAYVTGAAPPVESAGHAALMVTRIPNARTEVAARTLHLINARQGPETTDGIRHALALAPASGAVAAHELERLADARGLDVEVTWEPWDAGGTLTALFQRRDVAGTRWSIERARRSPWSGASMTAPAPAPGPRHRRYGSSPLLSKIAARQAASLREHVEARLPRFMVPSAFVFLDTVTLSPNGKIDRDALPAVDLGSTGDAQDEPATPAEAAMAAVWRDVLGLERVGRAENFFALGGDSLMAIQLVAKANKAGFRIAPRDVFQHQTIESLAAREQTVAAMAAAPAAPASSPGESGAFALTPFERWFLSLGHAEPGRFTQAVALEARRPLSRRGVTADLRALTTRHEALRSRIVDGRWAVDNDVPVDSRVVEVDFGEIAPAAMDAALDRLCAGLASSIDLAKAPLFAAALVRTGSGQPDRLVLVLHHFIVDPLSWAVLLGDLDQACAAVERGDALPAAPGMRPYRAALAALADSPQLAREAAAWQSMLTDSTEGIAATWDTAENIQASAASEVVRLTSAQTTALLDLPAKIGCGIEELLLAALGRALAAWSGQSRVLINVERGGRTLVSGHGEASQALGCFTTMVPCVVGDAEGDVAAEARRHHRERQTLLAGGAGCGVLRWLHPEHRQAMSALPTPRISFTHLGRIASSGGDIFASSPSFRAAAAMHTAMAPDARRPFALEIQTSVAAGRLTLSITYSRNLHAWSSVRAFLDAFARQLRSLGPAAPRQPRASGDRQRTVESAAGRAAASAAGIVDSYPLTPLQSGLLFLDQLTTRSRAYLVQCVGDIHGRLDEERFRAAWTRVIARHPVLRSVFAWEHAGQPLQHVHAAAPLELSARDLRTLAPAEQRRAIDDHLASDRERGFDLRVPPLLRVAVFRLADERHHFVLTYHHIIADAWSMSLVADQVLRAHDGRDEMPAPRTSYREFVAWIASRDGARAEAFWRGDLAGVAPTRLRLPPPSSASSASAQASAEVVAVLPREATDRLARRAREWNVTPNTVTHAAWALLLGRYAATDDVLYGQACSLRPPELDDVTSVVGLFLNTIPVRVRIERTARVADWLRRVQAHDADVREHAYSSLVDIQAWSGVPHHQPLFRLAFAYERFQYDPSMTRHLSQARLTGLASVEQTNYDLVLLVYPGDEVRCVFVYDPLALAADDVARMAASYLEVLTALTADGDRTLASLPALPAGEWRQTVVEFNATERAFDDRPIVRRIEELAGRTPDAEALRGFGDVVSYAQLDARANQLARVLRDGGVGPEVPVAILLDRSIALPIAVLAVWKAGGACVPLDPAYPPERLRFMLGDSGARVVITTSALRPPIEGQAPSPAIVMLDGEQGAGIDARARTPLPPVAFHADRLAYIIYTSGSTGRPKGVAVAHRGLENLATAMQLALRLDARSRVLQFSSFSFDAFMWELAGAWAAGAALCLHPQASLLPGPDLIAAIRRDGITHITLPPGALAVLPPAELPSLQTIVSAGEACAPDLVTRWGANRRFVNAYGPTETTVCATLAPCAPGEAPIGRPLANIQVHVLDEAGAPVPIGVTGALHVGGIGLARGYLGQPALTAERFIPNHLGLPGTRLYVTGDDVRWRADGQLEYAGRRDAQVKVRGHRVELGEIEAALHAQPGVLHAVAVVPEDEAHLVAFVVLEPAIALQPAASRDTPDGIVAALRTRLAATLPAYMIPSRIAHVTELPRTPAGKVDRARLAALHADRVEDGTRAAAAPRTRFERALIDIWENVLKRRAIGIHDDFFELGGHSLRVAQVASRIRSVLNVEVELQTLFSHPILADLASEIERMSAASTAAAAPIEARSPTSRARPLSYAQERLLFLHRLAPDSSAYNIVNAVRLEGPLDVAALRLAIETVVDRHEVLRTVFRWEDGQPIAEIGADAAPLFHVVDASPFGRTAREAEPAHAGAEAIALAIAREWTADPFDLERGPLTRFALVRRSPANHVLVWSLHHIACDGWSVPVFLREVGALYAAQRTAPVNALLPALSIQYADYAAWQRGRLDTGALATDIAYWRERLRDVPALAMPTDFPRPARVTDRGASVPITLTAAEMSAVRRFAHQHRATLFMTLLAAWQAVLARHTGQRDIAVGTSVANRTRGELEGLIGFFVNTIVMRTDLSDDPTVQTLIQRVRATALEGYAHQDVPFERIVAEVQPARELTRTALFQAFIVLENTPDARLELDGVRVEPLEMTTSTVKFDLELCLRERGDELTGHLAYRTDLFREDTIARLSTHFTRLLMAMVASPERSVSTLPLLDAGERVRVLEEWNATAAVSDQRPLPVRIAEHAVRTPHATAVRAPDGERTYEAFVADARRLARVLRACGVRTEVPVAVCLERSAEFAVAVLAVWEAGGVYVPLDPSYPRVRLAHMLHDSGAPVLITTSTVQASTGLTADAIVALDMDAAGIAAQDVAPLPHPPDPDHLAYIVYTSGTTGRPKGVAVTHRALANLAAAQGIAFDVDANSRVLQFASPGFDASLSELAVTWAAGATVCMGPGEAMLPGPGLIACLETQRITHVTLPPAAIAVLPSAALPALRTIVAAGEACAPELVTRWGAGRRFVNAYGPTETAVCATLARCTPGAAPIGQPIANVQVYVLDAAGEPVPVGIIGSLYVAGAGLARGYVRRPGLTAERFLPNPFGPAGGRMYATGDEVRWREDGQLDFIGRLDTQVKVRGHRVELGEIEAALRECTGVTDAAVVTRGDAPGDLSLMAWVCGDPPSAHRLRQELGRRLPAYMMPNAFMRAGALPVTASGKIDRRALASDEFVAAHGGARLSTSAPFEAPANAMEELIASIWQHRLGVPQVGKHDNFFDLGGHSLQLVAVFDDLSSRVGSRLSLADMFEHSTVARLAAHLERRSAPDDELADVRARARRHSRWSAGRREAREQAAQAEEVRS